MVLSDSGFFPVQTIDSTTVANSGTTIVQVNQTRQETSLVTTARKTVAVETGSVGGEENRTATMTRNLQAVTQRNLTGTENATDVQTILADIGASVEFVIRLPNDTPVVPPNLASANINPTTT